MGRAGTIRRPLLKPQPQIAGGRRVISHVVIVVIAHAGNPGWVMLQACDGVGQSRRVRRDSVIWASVWPRSWRREM
jgi:hypothetical protein